MPKALILIADGSEEIEFVTVYDVLMRAGFEVKSVGVDLANRGWALMTRNIRIVPDHANLHTLPPATAHDVYDILILPGGGPGAATFCKNERVLGMITNFRAAGKWVAAICAGTTALVVAQDKTGGTQNKVKVTSHPSVKEGIVKKGWGYSEEKVVVDEEVITSRGPGTALLFSLTIVEQLLGKKERDEVAGPMMVANTREQAMLLY